MADDAFLTWRARIIPEYAAENVASGRWTEEESLAQSQAQMDELLPDGVATAGHFLWTVRAEDGADVGILWVATDRRPGRVFIYDIEIGADRRGQGLGSATLVALEDWCRANGFSSIGLHVFGRNTGAWQLYKRMGYVETSVQMEKHL
jgi:GNAT superfamily N-acetyltransferase